MNKPLSNCCNAPTKVVGKTTKHYSCIKCLKPTDPAEPTPAEPDTLDELVRDICSVPYSKSKAKKLITAFIKRVQQKAREEMKGRCWCDDDPLEP